VVPKK